MSNVHNVSRATVRALDESRQEIYRCICQKRAGDHCPEVEKQLLADGNPELVALIFSRLPSGKITAE